MKIGGTAASAGEPNFFRAEGMRPGPLTKPGLRERPFPRADTPAGCRVGMGTSSTATCLDGRTSIRGPRIRVLRAAAGYNAQVKGRFLELLEDRGFKDSGGKGMEKGSGFVRLGSGGGSG